MAAVRGTAVVTLTVEIDVGSTWGSDCSLEQLMRQARVEAAEALRGGLVINDLTASSATRPRHARIVGEPRVKAVIVEEDI